MKRPDCSKTPLMQRFRRAGAAEGHRPKADAMRLMADADPPWGTASFPPCLTPAASGIFRLGGGRAGTVSKNVRESLPEQGKIGRTRGDFASSG